jgi:phosphoglycolate phosphatase
VNGVRLVVFDLDGTLVDSCRDLASAVNRALATVAPGHPPLPLQTVRSFVGDGAAMLVSRSLAQAGLAIPVETVLPVFLDCYGGVLLDTTLPYPGVPEALQALSDRMLAVLTNKPGDMSRTILEGLGLSQHFFGIVGGGDVAGKKPDPGGLRALMSAAGASARETVMVGDSAVDVATARAAGTRVVGVTYGLAPASLEIDPPDLLIDDMRTLPAALATLPA